MHKLTAVHQTHTAVRTMRRAKPALAPPKWPGPLAGPVQPMDTHTRMRAVSVLFGIEFLDGTRHPDAISLDQAHDVLRWANAGIP